MALTIGRAGKDPGNLLNLNQRGPISGGWTGTNATIAYSGAPWLSLTAIATSVNGMFAQSGTGLGNTFPAVAGHVYRCTAQFFASTANDNARVFISPYDSTGAAIGVGVFGGLVSTPVGVLTTVQADLTAPANTAYIALCVGTGSCTINDNYLVETASVVDLNAGILQLPEPTNWNTDNGQITLSGYFQISPITDALRLRDQLLGYQDNWDEPIIPVVVGSEPRLTGYYRVLGVRITTDLEAMAVGFLGYEVALEPVSGFARPLFESVVTGALMTNAVGAVAGDVVQFHGYPALAAEYYRGAATSSDSRDSSDGSASLNFNTAGLISDTASFSIDPASFYTTSCLIEQGLPLQPVVGRLLTVADAINWRLSNGLVRLTIDNAGTIYTSHWSSAAWQVTKAYQIGTAALQPGITNFTGLTILRNSVEECSIRLACATNAGLGNFGLGRVTLDLSLRRGDRIVRGFLSTDIAVAGQVRLLTNEAATAITYGAVTTGGIRATANDATGNRYVLLSYQAATTSDLTNGRLTLNVAAKTMDIGFGCEVGGSGAAGQSTAINIAKQYLAAQVETQRIVSR